MSDQDIYSKLRPPAPTPDDEICRCREQKPIKLMNVLSYNPLHCIDCNLEIDPKTLGLTRQIVDGIAFWCRIDDAIYRLWLASGEYETWAKNQLSDIHSPVNALGLAVRKEVNAIRRCYSSLFQDQSEDNFTPITHCPSCRVPLESYTKGIFRQLICERCSIITVGE